MIPKGSDPVRIKMHIGQNLQHPVKDLFETRTFVPQGVYTNMPTSSITFRIDRDQTKRLGELAADKRISLNTLTTQILDDYLKFEFVDPRVGFFRCKSTS